MAKLSNFYRDLGGQALKAMSNYPVWVNLPDPVKSKWKRYIKKSAAVIGYDLNKQVDLVTLYEAKLTWINFLMENKVLDEVYTAVSAQEKAKIGHQLQGELALFALAVADPVAAASRIQEHSSAYREFLAKPAGERIPPETSERNLLRFLGLSDQALDLFDKHKLTLELLLRYQPWLIISI